ncbi:hypothetical protein ACTHGU_12330 [Chitinophagaceae bacterium MMS25-I14]
MKNVLIPTDFTEASLSPVIKLAAAFPDEEYNIILVHMFSTPDGITELLMLHRSIPVSTLFSDDLRSECRRIKQRCGDVVKSIAFRPVYGTGKKLFNDFLQANKIDIILYDDCHHYELPHRYSADIITHFRKTVVAVIKTSELISAKRTSELPVQFNEYVNV